MISKERLSPSVEEVTKELFGSSLSKTEFSDFSFDDGYEVGVGMLMFVIKVYDGAFITLIYGGGSSLS